MNIKIVGEEPQPVEIKQQESTPVITGGMLEQSVGQMFDLLPSEMSRFSDKLGLLVAYAKTQTEDHSPEGIKWCIRALEGRVGTPPIGEKWLPYLTKYCYIKLESMKMQKEVEKYERN